MAGTPYDRRPVADPAELGIDATALDALFTRVQVDVDEGRLPSCQVALARDGQVAVWRTFGDAAVGVALRHVLRHEGGRRGRGVDPHR